MKVKLMILLVASLGVAGCSQETGEAGDDPAGEVASAATGPTCSPGRAAGAVNRYQKALHDSLAFAEGTEARGKDGYNILFTHRTISSCARHPNQRICSGRLCSTAAGRYQFLTDTWNATARALGSRSFEPEQQEKGAEYLIKRVRRVNVPADRVMTASEFSNAMSKLSYEWASLPPGRYGQPIKTHAQMRSDYCRNVGGC